jgi:hypothetical protein
MGGEQQILPGGAIELQELARESNAAKSLDQPSNPAAVGL